VQYLHSNFWRKEAPEGDLRGHVRSLGDQMADIPLSSTSAGALSLISVYKAL